MERELAKRLCAIYPNIEFVDARIMNDGNEKVILVEYEKSFDSGIIEHLTGFYVSHSPADVILNYKFNDGLIPLDTLRNVMNKDFDVPGVDTLNFSRLVNPIVIDKPVKIRFVNTINIHDDNASFGYFVSDILGSTTVPLVV